MDEPKKRQVHVFISERGNSISPCISTSSPFCKGGLRGIFLIQTGLIENLPKETWIFLFIMTGFGKNVW